MDKTCFSSSKVVATADGSLSMEHPVHGELFHSSAGAALEARDLYIGSSGIVAALQAGRNIRVLDVGLGLGYNAMATLEILSTVGSGLLEIISLEVEAELVALLGSGDAPWQQGWPAPWLERVSSLKPNSNKSFIAEAGSWQWTVLCGDALSINLPGSFDFIWQDPFSPEKNPSMWSEDWFAKVKHSSYAHTQLLSYSVSRPVKDALTQSGWVYERLSTTTAKRHWLRATPNTI